MLSLIHISVGQPVARRVGGLQLHGHHGHQDGTLMKTATAKVTMVAMELETTYSARCV